MRHKLMPFLSLHLNGVVEITSRLRHGYCPYGLPHYDHYEAQHQACFSERWGQEVGFGGKDGVRQDALEEGDRMCDIVGGAILGKEESGDVGDRGVVPRRSVVLQKMENRERCHKERRSPDGAMIICE